VATGATVKEAVVSASDVSIGGAGKVESVTVTEESQGGVTITTPGTTVKNESDASVPTTPVNPVNPVNPPSPYYPSFTVTAGLTPTAAGWSDSAFTDTNEDGVWDQFEGGSTSDYIGPSRFVDGSGGITQALLAPHGADCAIQYFLKIVYSNYTFTGGAEDLGVIIGLTPTGETNTAPLTPISGRFYHDSANRTIYYFDGLWVADLVGGVYYPNARVGATVPLTVTLTGVSDSKSASLAIPAVALDPDPGFEAADFYGITATVTKAFDKPDYKIALGGSITGLSVVEGGDFKDAADDDGDIFLARINVRALLGGNLDNGSKVTVNQTNPALSAYYNSSHSNGVKHQAYEVNATTFGTDDPYLNLIFDGDAENKTVTIKLWKSEQASGTTVVPDVTVTIDYSGLTVTAPVPSA
jgi:hypothetical protein